MDDDLAVPRALVTLHETVAAGNAALSAGDEPGVSTALLSVRAMLDVLGLDPEAEPWRGAADEGAAHAALDALVAAEIDARSAARDAKDWAAADAIRDRLAAAGVVLEDGADGVRWTVKGER